MQKKTNNNFFSNAKIAESIIYSLKEILMDTDETLNQEYFENIMNKIKPDIDKSTIKYI